MSSYDFPYEWFALIDLYLGNESEDFENELFDVFRNLKEGKDKVILLVGPAGSGKSTLLHILRHIKDPKYNGRHIKIIDDIDSNKIQRESHTMILAASNRVPINADDICIFYTTGMRFVPRIWDEMVNICCDRFDEIYEYYNKGALST